MKPTANRIRSIAKLLVLSFFIGTTSAPAIAEIVKTATPTDTGFKFQWWPKLPTITGWHQDMNASSRYSINALVPDGSSFTKSTTVIYGNASYKPRTPENKTVADLIRQDKDDFLKSDPNMKFEKLPDLVDKDGQNFSVLSFSPSSDKGNWEVTAYGEEEDYFLVFCISSKTENDLHSDLNTFKSLVENYRK